MLDFGFDYEDQHPEILLLIIDHFAINHANNQKVDAGKRRERPYACLPHLPIAANHAQDIFRVPSVLLWKSARLREVKASTMLPFSIFWKFVGGSD